MIGTVLYSTIVSLGFTYAGFRSFQALKSENEEKLMQDSSVFHASDFLDGGGSIPPPPDEEEEDNDVINMTAKDFFGPRKKPSNTARWREHCGSRTNSARRI